MGVLGVYKVSVSERGGTKVRESGKGPEGLGVVYPLRTSSKSEVNPEELPKIDGRLGK